MPTYSPSQNVSFDATLRALGSNTVWDIYGFARDQLQTAATLTNGGKDGNLTLRLIVISGSPPNASPVTVTAHWHCA